MSGPTPRPISATPAVSPAVDGAHQRADASLQTVPAAVDAVLAPVASMVDDEPPLESEMVVEAIGQTGSHHRGRLECRVACCHRGGGPCEQGAGRGPARLQGGGCRRHQRHHRHQWPLPPRADQRPRETACDRRSAVCDRRTPFEVLTRFTGEEQPRGPSGSVSDVTQAVLDTFAGSRVTATRLHDDTRLGAPRSANGA